MIMIWSDECVHEGYFVISSAHACVGTGDGFVTGPS